MHADMLFMPADGLQNYQQRGFFVKTTRPAWLAGCALALGLTAMGSAAQAADSRVVVGVIDSGINPYHDFFNSNGELYRDTAPSAVSPAVLAEFGIDNAHTLHLTRSGNFAADYAADQAMWDQVKPGELYWFAGTNIMAISFAPGSRILLPDDSSDTHGVGVTASVLRGNPEAVVVFVEGTGADGESYAFNHPSIDIVTTSYGTPGSLPLPYHLTSSYAGVVEQGKLHFGAADNSPALALPDGTAGPWWSIGIAGFEEYGSEGKQLSSGSLTDFVADFSQDLPYCADCESGLQTGVGGTSFATPLSAGTTSKVLLEARRAVGHQGGIDAGAAQPVMVNAGGVSLSNWQLRRALEEAAYVPSLAEYDPFDGVFELAAPTTPVAPYLLVGWGAITPDPAHQVVEQTLAQLGISGVISRSKSADTCAYMSSLIEARQAYWNYAVLFSDSLLSSEDPYLSCQ